MSYDIRSFIMQQYERNIISAFVKIQYIGSAYF